MTAATSSSEQPVTALDVPVQLLLRGDHLGAEAEAGGVGDVEELPGGGVGGRYRVGVIAESCWARWRGGGHG